MFLAWLKCRWVKVSPHHLLQFTNLIIRCSKEPLLTGGWSTVWEFGSVFCLEPFLFQVLISGKAKADSWAATSVGANSQCSWCWQAQTGIIITALSIGSQAALSPLSPNDKLLTGLEADRFFSIHQLQKAHQLFNLTVAYCNYSALIGCQPSRP